MTFNGQFYQTLCTAFRNLIRQLRIHFSHNPICICFDEHRRHADRVRWLERENLFTFILPNLRVIISKVHSL